MDSAVPTEQTEIVPIEEDFLSKLETLIDAWNPTFQKMDESDFGSYSIAVSFDGASFAGFQRRFGWGWTEKQAFAMVLEDLYKLESPDQSLIEWFGPKWDELKAIN